MSTKIEKILSEVARGALTVEKAAAKLNSLGFEDLGFARVDHHRQERCGFPEVIYAEGKDSEQIAKIAKRVIANENLLLITRLDEAKFRLLKKQIPGLVYNKSGRVATLSLKPPQIGKGILIVSAGTSDIPVAEEAACTCEALGYTPDRLYDVGVAGIHRLLAESEQLKQARVIIVVAGMEGALPSVVGGLVDVPVIAVPTSVGYGTSFGGMTALLAMLNSCASGVTVVNIDNGFGAAVAAVKILRLEDRKK